jgi:hypothetical protein
MAWRPMVIGANRISPPTAAFARAVLPSTSGCAWNAGRTGISSLARVDRAGVVVVIRSTMLNIAIHRIAEIFKKKPPAPRLAAG